MKKTIALINLMDEAGFYKIADQMQSMMTRTAAWPYNMSALDELPFGARNTSWQKNQEDYDQFDKIFFEKLKKWRLPDYKKLHVDESDQGGLEDRMHGNDPITGPAYTDQGSLASSPSMSGGLDYFTWDEAHDSNEGPEYWKNLLPRR